MIAITEEDKVELGKHILEVFSSYVDAHKGENVELIDKLWKSSNGFDKIVATITNPILERVEFGWMEEGDPADSIKSYKSLVLFEEVLNRILNDCRRHQRAYVGKLKEE